MTGVRCGVFEALRDGPCSTGEVAEARGLDADTLELVLRLLAASDYLSKEVDGRFSLTERSRWEVLEDSPYRLTPWVTIFGMWWDRLVGAMLLRLRAPTTPTTGRSSSDTNRLPLHPAPAHLTARAPRQRHLHHAPPPLSAIVPAQRRSRGPAAFPAVDDASVR